MGGCLLTFLKPTGWALIQGWAVNQINTVIILKLLLLLILLLLLKSNVNFFSQVVTHPFNVSSSFSLRPFIPKGKR